MITTPSPHVVTRTDAPWLAWRSVYLLVDAPAPQRAGEAVFAFLLVLAGVVLGGLTFLLWGML